MKNIKFLLLMLLLFLSLGCQTTSTSTYETVDVERSINMISQKEVEVIDVRTEDEFKQGHIPNAQLIPLDQIEDQLVELDKDKSYLIVCRSGSRSKQASELLTKHGFTKIYNLEKGMNEWPYDLEHE